MPVSDTKTDTAIGHWRRRLLGSGLPLFLSILFIGVARTCAAASDPSVAQLCDRAAIDAARQYGVPLDVLRAITRTETGRVLSGRLQPWPWTVNMEGRGVWFGSREEAQDYVRRHAAHGARSFDVGCFQLNYKWHGTAFTTAEAMLDPERNAGYAAGFLKRLHAELGDWTAAAGAYHSRTPDLARRYSARFDRIRAGLTDTPMAHVPPSTAPARPGPGPLIASGQTAMGSLVPIIGHRRASPFVPLDNRIADLAPFQH